MRYIDEYRDSKAVSVLVERINSTAKKNWSIMEVCGGQTHTIMKYGLEEMLPSNINLIHGPGCPVCVTPIEMIDKAIELASRDDVVLTSYGDMLRVPGSKSDLLKAKANGGDIRIVYSPLDAIKIAEREKEKNIVFFAVGFETTAPATAMSVSLAKKKGLSNFFILCSHVLIPPAIDLLLSSNNSRIDGLLAPGHVCSIIGYEDLIQLAVKYKKPIVVTGFEPVDILQGILLLVRQLERSKFVVENQYSRLVKREGNITAKKLLDEVFVIIERNWRGIGEIQKSGYRLKDEYSDYDAEKFFDLQKIKSTESKDCITGEILRGLVKPIDCKLFGSGCTPDHPMGAPMVSSEGTCAAFYKYKKQIM
jgi:hydrogenase expression/formation protein HypD